MDVKMVLSPGEILFSETHQHFIVSMCKGLAMTTFSVVKRIAFLTF